MGLFKEFKEFALRGNMVDLAIGVIIGAAFSKVVSSLVADVIMPPIGLLLGGVDFSSLSLKLHIPGTDKPPVEVRYGSFLNALIDLLLVASVIFLVIKTMNTLYSKKPKGAEPEPPKTKECTECAMNIPLKAKICPYCKYPPPNTQ